MFHHEGMKRVTVRDLRQRWPEVERMLEREGEVEITRDGKTVARLLRHEAKARTRRRVDFDALGTRIRKIWGGRVVNLIEATLAEEREDD